MNIFAIIERVLHKNYVLISECALMWNCIRNWIHFLVEDKIYFNFAQNTE